MGLHSRFVLASVLALCAHAAAAHAGWTAAQSDAASTLAKAFLKTDSGLPRTPGLSVAVSRNGDIVFSGGFGEARPSVPATASTVYQVGSLSKQFTAAAVLSLIESGTKIANGGARLALDTPIGEVIPGASAWSIEGSPPITVKHLLSMTSSLPNFTRHPPAEVDPWGAVPAPRLLEALTHLVPSGFPGSFEYSNTSYFLLAELLESPLIEGGPRNYRSLVEQAAWKPAGLTATGFRDDPRIVDVLAAPHYKRKPAFLQSDWLKGSGDAASTVLDIQTWVKSLLSERVIHRPLLDAMFADTARVDVWTWYGMGWFITHKDGIDYFAHSGSVPGYTAYSLIARRQQGAWASVSILTNSDGVEDLDKLAETLVEMALSQSENPLLTKD